MDILSITYGSLNVPFPIHQLSLEARAAQPLFPLIEKGKRFIYSLFFSLLNSSLFRILLLINRGIVKINVANNIEENLIINI